MNIENILENNKIKMIIKILISTVLSLSVIVILLSKINIKKIEEQKVKINFSKNIRSNYPKTEAVWAVLEIPSLKIKTNVYRGEDNMLNYGALHHKESYFPKDGGTIVIAGNNTYLKNLSKLKTKDEIIIKTIYGTYKYKVEKTRIKNADELSNLLEIKNNEESLILYTAYPETKGYKADRLVVYAK